RSTPSPRRTPSPDAQTVPRSPRAPTRTPHTRPPRPDPKTPGTTTSSSPALAAPSTSPPGTPETAHRTWPTSPTRGSLSVPQVIHIHHQHQLHHVRVLHPHQRHPTGLHLAPLRVLPQLPQTVRDHPFQLGSRHLRRRLKPTPHRRPQNRLDDLRVLLHAPHDPGPIPHPEAATRASKRSPIPRRAW